jgi:hypothetical protein
MGNLGNAYKFISESRREVTIRDVNGNVEVKCISEKWGVICGLH